MEGNRDEAQRALSIAQQKWKAGDAEGALRVARKSHSLYPTSDSERLITQYQKQEPTKPTAAEEEKAVPAPDKEKSETPAGTNNRVASAEQTAAVRTVLAARHDYYAVLGVDRGATAAELKRAYRKAALAFHPDKNTARGADDAFKLVAHAFTVLSDADKRTHYDRFGDKQPTASAAGRGGYAHAGNQEITPEDLFNMFFGGGGGPAFATASAANGGRFGVQFGPGIRTARHRQQQQQRHREEEEEQTLWGMCRQLAPLLVLVLAFFGASLASLLIGSTDHHPQYAFERGAGLTAERRTAHRGVTYWVAAGEALRPLAPTFEHNVEAQYVARLQRRCRQQQEHKRMAVYQAQGWFGIGDDVVRLRKAQEMPLPACDELRTFK